MKRQWPNLVRTRRINVHLLTEPIRIQEERPRPSFRQRRQLVRSERQRELVTRPRDHKHVIRCEQQFAHVALACISASHHLPRRRKRHLLIVISERLSSVRRMLERKATPTQISNRRIEVCDLQREISTRRVDQNLVPVNAHVSHDAYVTARTQKLSSEIDDDCLRASDRNSDVLNHGVPVTILIFYLKSRQLQTLSTLRRREVVAGPRIISPASEQQLHAR